MRLSAKDFNYLPINIRWPLFPLRDYFGGNDLPETTYYARRLEQLGVDYLHIDSGFGFPNPKGSPADYPDEGFQNFVNATRYLSGKARARAAVFNHLPPAVRKKLFGLGYRFQPAANADFAAAIRRVVSIPVIANGGFQDRRRHQPCPGHQKMRHGRDRQAAARQPRSGRQLATADMPANPCSFCTLCCSQTAVFPLGCYDQRRFSSLEDDGPDHRLVLAQLEMPVAPPRRAAFHGGDAVNSLPFAPPASWWRC